MPVDQAIINHLASQIKLVVMDVDGVLTDGKLLYGNNGEEIKAFTTQDGQAIKLLQKANIETAIITGRSSTIVERRAKELGIKHLYQGSDGKIILLRQLAQQLVIKPEQIAYIGDDLPDLAPIQWVGLGIAPQNARLSIKQYAQWVTQTKGGEGVMVEVTDIILHAQNKFKKIMSEFLLD